MLEHSYPHGIEIYRPSEFELDMAHRRCTQLGIDPAQKTLAPAHAIAVQDKTIQSHANYMYTQKLKTYYDDFFALTACFNIAYYILDSNMYIYNRGGNADLLAELKKLGVQVGSNLSEDIAGYNAISLYNTLFGNNYMPDTCIMVDAGESYLDILKPYVFLAVGTKSYLESYGIQYHLLVIRKADFGENCICLAQFIRSFSECLIAKAYNLPPLEFTNAFQDYRDTIQIFTDGNGYISLVNDRFCHLLNLDTPKIGGHLVSEVIPATRAALHSVRAGKNVYMSSIQMKNASGEYEAYYMDAVGIYSAGGKLSDILFSMREVQAEKRRAGRLVSDGAFFTFDDIIGHNNPEFLRTKELAMRIAVGNSNVLIAGESGTGKEMFAQSIHHASPRRNQPFISVNCAAIPKELISSELFGYDEGAFTGAKKNGSPGKFEIADGGTLFLDEIGEMPMDMQSVLLRVIEEQRITRLGSSKSRKVDVRIIAASNRNLLECVKNQTFRADLYYRINVLQLNLIPLRMRKEDIPTLAEHFLHQLSGSAPTNVTGISKDVMGMLIAYDWPGNIRELRNIIERAINVCTGNMITPNDIMLGGTSGIYTTAAGNRDFSVSAVNRDFDAYEIERIKSLIVKYNNNKTLVAKELGISRRTLYNKLKKAQQAGENIELP